ncbi:MAG: HEAT repeat domain-containing protein [Candidatus Freyarchaeota archaeon]
MNEGVELESVEGLVRRSKYGKEWRALVERLIRALRDENRYVRWGAAGALGELGDARAVQPLVEALKDEDWNVREITRGATATPPIKKIMECDGKRHARG